MLENGPPCCPRPPHLPPPAPPVAAPQLPRYCRGWGQPRELLGIATQAAAPTAITESWNALSWKDPQGLLSPTPGPVQSPTIPPGMLRVGFAGGNTRRDLQRGLQLPIPSPWLLRKGCILRPLGTTGGGCSSFILQHPERTLSVRHQICWNPQLKAQTWPQDGLPAVFVHQERGFQPWD